jgi:type IV pilus assembly protein PilC
MATATKTRTFFYEAVDSGQNIVKGKIDSDSASSVANVLREQRMTVLDVSEAGTGLQKELSIPGFGGRTNLKDLAIFTRQFASMMSSGLTLLRALAILEEQATKAKLREAIGQVRQSVQGGSTLSSAMAQHSDQFPMLMVNMIKAGEAGGFMDDALERVAKMYEADANLRAKIKGAMTYPVIVLVFAFLLGTGVIVFIVPVFAKMFKNLGGKLPLPTQIMVDLSHNIWWVAPGVILLVFGTMRLYKRQMRVSGEFRLKADRIKMRLPVFGKLLTKLAISRWARNLGTLLAVGVPVIQALEVVAGTAGNAVLGEAMEDVKASVRIGQQMSVPLAKHDLFPPMVVQMLEVGEETGQTTEMLEKVADFYDHEVETATEALTSALEPLLVVLMGAVIGVMVICLYLPMFSIYQHIQSN